MAKVNSKNHFKKWRLEQYKVVDDFISKSEMVAIADIANLPANAVKDFRKILKDNGYVVKVSKVSIIKKILEKNNYSDLISICTGNVALIGSAKSPFTMYSLIKKNASKSGAKVGMIAPDDIVVPTGDTGIAPGPALSDFKAVKIDTQIKNGKIFVPKDTVVAKKDSVIDAKVVSILGKLNIKPIKVLMRVKGAYTKSDGILYPESVLDINIDKYRSDIVSAYLNTFNLALSRAIVTPQTIKPLIKKAYRSTKALAVSQSIVTPETVKDILGKAHKVGTGISKKVNL